jgi:flagellar hook-length control protein FliK
MAKVKNQKVTPELKNNLQDMSGKLEALMKELPEKSAAYKKLASAREKIDLALNGRTHTFSSSGQLDTIIKNTISILEETKKSINPYSTAASSEKETRKAFEKNHPPAEKITEALLRKEPVKEHTQQNELGFSKDNKMRDPEIKSLQHAKPETRALFREQLNELVHNSKVTVTDGKNATISMKMYPEKLGAVTVNLGLENGTLTGRFLVESNEARETLLGALSDVRTVLENEGLTLGAFHVNVRDNKRENSYVTPDTIPHNEHKNTVEEYSTMQRMTHEGSLDLVG